MTLDLDATLLTAKKPPHLEEDLRLPPDVRLHRPRRTRNRRSRRHPAAPRQRRIQHRHRPAFLARYRAGGALTVAAASLKQLPRAYRRGRKTLIRTDTAGGAHAFLDRLTKRGRWLSYSVGMTITDQFHTAINQVPAWAWTPAYNANGQAREGAWICEVTDMVDLTAWPKGMRLIVRSERPHPGAQLRITDRQGNRLTAFATNTPRGQLADLELHHRRRARAEDPIRAAKDTGLANLPLHAFAANQVWIELVMLALAGHGARRWEPERLRLRLFWAVARLVRTGRRQLLRFNRSWPWGELLVGALARLRVLLAPG